LHDSLLTLRIFAQPGVHKQSTEPQHLSSSYKPWPFSHANHRFKKYLSNLAILIEQVSKRAAAAAASAASTTAQLHLHGHRTLQFNRPEV
jgi:hypothetical protein